MTVHARRHLCGKMIDVLTGTAARTILLRSNGAAVSASRRFGTNFSSSKHLGSFLRIAIAHF